MFIGKPIPFPKRPGRCEPGVNAAVGIINDARSIPIAPFVFYRRENVIAVTDGCHCEMEIFIGLHTFQLVCENALLFFLRTAAVASAVACRSSHHKDGESTGKDQFESERQSASDIALIHKLHLV